jgi:hypothetical protein
MKKFRPLIIIIILLGSASFWFIVNRTHGTFDKEEDAFAVPNKKDITKVILVDTDKKRVELSKVNGVWMANGKYVAREELIISLFDVLARIKTLCPVPRAGHDYVMRSLFEKNIKVEVYTGEDKAAQVYYVGGPTPEGTGTYMLREIDGKADARPYITYLPGLQGYLTPRYQTDEEVWRTRTLFKYEPEEIKSLSIEYPGDESKSFVLERVAKDSFSLSPLMSEKSRINQNYQQKYIRQYLQFYSSISIETFDNKNSHKDSIVHTTTPYCIFTITSTDNKVNKARLFYQTVNRRSKMPFDKDGKPMTYDVDHYYASINNDQDFTVVQYYVFGKLLRSYQDFFFKPGSTVNK